MLLLRPMGRGQQHGFRPLSKGGRSLPVARKRRNLNNARLEEFEEFLFFRSMPPTPCWMHCTVGSCVLSFLLCHAKGSGKDALFPSPQSLGCWFPKKLDQGKPPLEGGAPSARRYHGDVQSLPCVLPYDTVVTSVLQPALTVPLFFSPAEIYRIVSQKQLPDGGGGGAGGSDRPGGGGQVIDIKSTTTDQNSGQNKKPCCNA